MSVATTDTPELGALLLAHARDAIAESLGVASTAPADAPELHRRGATFVTLRRDSALRGCIGSLRPQRALLEDVRGNAVAAASRDTRFTPVKPEELPVLRVEVSLLSDPEFVEFVDEAELCAKLRPGIDGVILFSGCRSATFLPQVWDELPQPEAFLAALKHKAGLDPQRPTPNAMAATYTVSKWHEDDAVKVLP